MDLSLGRGRAETVTTRDGSHLLAAESSHSVKMTIAVLVAAAVISGGANARERSADSSETTPDIRAKAETPPSAETTRDLIRAVLGDIEDVWDELFREGAYGIYAKPALVLVSRWASSECGRVDVSRAPFYCARDTRIYTDPAFVEELAKRSGDFAAAYVIAREVGHHVQALRAVQQLDRAAAPATEQQSTQSQMQFETQADCYAGVWAHFVRKRNQVDAAELDSGSAAAVSIGNATTDGDYIARRLRAFKHGLSTGSPRACDLSALPG